MAEKYSSKAPHPHDPESPSSPHESHKSSNDHDHESSPTLQPKVTYSYVPKAVSVPPQPVKNVKQTYVSTHYYSKPAKHKHSHTCPPIVCDPQYVVRDCYVQREVPVIHPIINVTRHHIVNVPKHYYKSSTKNVMVDPGCPGSRRRPPGFY